MSEKGGRVRRRCGSIGFGPRGSRESTTGWGTHVALGFCVVCISWVRVMSGDRGGGIGGCREGDAERGGRPWCGGWRGTRGRVCISYRKGGNVIGRCKLKDDGVVTGWHCVDFERI